MGKAVDEPSRECVVNGELPDLVQLCAFSQTFVLFLTGTEVVGYG